MGKRVELTIGVPPVVASRPRVTRWSTFYGKKYTKFKKDMQVFLSNYDDYKFTELVKVDVIFNVQIPKSYSKKKKLSLINNYCDNNGDIDNYSKHFSIV